mmetsp:Transcript_2683/g.7539  ORF Transcript_2683/g.7539 Transcript_2683/m.7539 type:complete len:286 (+) Transcript_2683:58-915(+)
MMLVPTEMHPSESGRLASPALRLRGPSVAQEGSTVSMRPRPIDGLLSCAGMCDREPVPTSGAAGSDRRLLRLLRASTLGLPSRRCSIASSASRWCASFCSRRWRTSSSWLSAVSRERLFATRDSSPMSLFRDARDGPILAASSSFGLPGSGREPSGDATAFLPGSAAPFGGPRAPKELLFATPEPFEVFEFLLELFREGVLFEFDLRTGVAAFSRPSPPPWWKCAAWTRPAVRSISLVSRSSASSSWRLSLDQTFCTSYCTPSRCFARATPRIRRHPSMKLSMLM